MPDVDLLDRDATAERDIALDLIRKVMPLFVDPHVFQDGVWPYRVEERASAPGTRYSFSTNAMIVWSLALILGRLEPSEDEPRGSRDCYQALAPIRPLPFLLALPEKVDGVDFQGRLDIVFREATRRLGAELLDPDGTRPNQLLTGSKTFGSNDPLTLNWLLTVDAHFPQPARAKIAKVASWELQRVRGVLERRKIKTNLPRWPGEPGEPGEKHTLERSTGPDGSFRHSFWLQRYAMLAAAINENKDPLTRFGHLAQRFLEDRIHYHNAVVDTTSFDPGELVFSLETLVRWAPHLPERALLDHSFDAMRKYATQASYWRPTRPVTANTRGEVLLPISVEIASSLLRLCHELDTKDDRNRFFADGLPMFQQYTEWLRAQLAAVQPPKSSPLYGWHSEHDYARGYIHTWQTSQVVAFLVSYATQLQRHVAIEARKAARLKVTHPRSFPKPDEIASGWAEWARKNEPIRSVKPVRGHARSYRILNRVLTDFVEPRLKDPRGLDNLSMVLYGPPGTGKTTHATELAQRLGFPLITITTSDFLVGGESELEARAKGIFDVLLEQYDAVILFDELDRLLMDRTAVGYEKQSALFQFMTPGMLTKFQDLHDAGRCIFVLATNHRERIDSAILRAGRIDQQYLLLPPNHARRVEFLKDFIRDRCGRDPNRFSKRLLDGVDEVAAATPLWVYGELKRLVHDAYRAIEGSGERGEGRNGTVSDAALVRTLSDASRLEERPPPLLSLSRYGLLFRKLFLAEAKEEGARPERFDWNEEPWDEVLLLVHLLVERDGSVSPLSDLSSRYREDESFLRRFVHCHTEEDLDRGLRRVTDPEIEASTREALLALKDDEAERRARLETEGRTRPESEGEGGGLASGGRPESGGGRRV